MITTDSMVDRLMHIPQEELAEMCCAAHEDQYGFKGRHLLRHTVPELVSWWVSHYFWNEETQCWESVSPVEDEEDWYEEEPSSWEIMCSETV